MITVTSTGTKATRVIGALALIGVGWLVLFGLVLSPADEAQGEAVRMLYIHVPTAWLAFLAFGVTALGSALYLFPNLWPVLGLNAPWVTSSLPLCSSFCSARQMVVLDRLHSEMRVSHAGHATSSPHFLNCSTLK